MQNIYNAHSLPPCAFFLILDEDALGLLLALVSNQSLGRLSCAGKRYHNALVDELHTRMVEFGKVLLFPNESIMSSSGKQDGLEWTPLSSKNDIVIMGSNYSIDEERTRRERSGFVLRAKQVNALSAKHAFCCNKAVDVTIHSIRCFRENVNTRACAGPRGVFQGSDTEWEAQKKTAAESDLLKIRYTIVPSIFISEYAGLVTFRPESKEPCLAEELQISEFLIHTRYGLNGPGVLLASDPNRNCFPGGSGDLFTLTQTCLPGIDWAQTTSEALVRPGSTIYVTFRTEFGIVVVKGYLYINIGRSQQVKSILNHHLGSKVVRAPPGECFLNVSGEHHAPSRIVFSDLSFEPKAKPKLMPIVGNRSMWRR